MSLSPLETDEHTGNASTKASAINSFLDIDSSSIDRLDEVNTLVTHNRLRRGIADRLIIGLHKTKGFRELESMLLSLGESAQLVSRDSAICGVAYASPASVQKLPWS